MCEDRIKYKNSIEALLFAWGDMIEISEISKYFDIEKSIVEDIIYELKNEYNDRGLRIQIIGKSVQLNSNPEYNKIISDFGVKQKKRNLSNAAMETLSIIAYLQPTTKSVIEQIRGVKSDGSVRTLLDRGLIREAGNLNQPGRPIVYKTTDKFLKSFEIENLNYLPELVDKEEILELLKITEIDFDDIIEMDPVEEDEDNVESISSDVNYKNNEVGNSNEA
ncbi:SMC-Scp complex subunit ScpB [Ezakiella peruensis]|uniref:SMC-Scp complex subunit ScpB n=1 Tax=Ezakiella peruensis TaxID=1464038 RepID=UPI000C1B3F11|nr:SMC-Scp complex subunit ScpB [Ezakiella peruensis]